MKLDTSSIKARPVPCPVCVVMTPYRYKGESGLMVQACSAAHAEMIEDRIIAAEMRAIGRAA